MHKVVLHKDNHQQGKNLVLYKRPSGVEAQLHYYVDWKQKDAVEQEMVGHQEAQYNRKTRKDDRAYLLGSPA